MTEFSQYKQINSKLKKRFLLKKPNLNETSEQFQELSKELKDQKAYAGFCCLAVARCEQNLGHRNNQLQALLDSARHFRDSQEIVASLDAYTNALQMCDGPMRKPIQLELARFYVQLNRMIEAADIYREAQLWTEAAACFIEAELFDQAFECYALIPDKNELSVQDSISFRLLRLILFQTQSFEKSTLDKTWLERYTYDDTNPVYNQLDYKGSQSCQELGLLMRTFELLLLDRQPQYLTAVQLDHQLNQRLNQQNQFLMRKLLDPIRLAS